MVRLSASGAVVRGWGCGTAGNSLVCGWHELSNLCRDFPGIPDAVFPFAALHYPAQGTSRSVRSLADSHRRAKPGARDAHRHSVRFPRSFSDCAGSLPLRVTGADLGDILHAPEYLLSDDVTIFRLVCGRFRAGPADFDDASRVWLLHFAGG